MWMRRSCDPGAHTQGLLGEAERGGLRCFRHRQTPVRSGFPFLCRQCQESVVLACVKCWTHGSQLPSPVSHVVGHMRPSCFACCKCWTHGSQPSWPVTHVVGHMRPSCARLCHILLDIRVRAVLACVTCWTHGSQLSPLVPHVLDTLKSPSVVSIRPSL
jgi:hypothetical protein